MRKFLIVFLAILSAAPASAQVHVFVDSTTKDPVGKRFDFVIKEKLRSSSSFALSYDENESPIKISLVTLDPDGKTNNAGNRTIYSFNILISNPGGFDYLYTSFVGYCGSQVLQSCAEDVAEELGVAIEDIRQALSKAAAKKPFD